MDKFGRNYELRVMDESGDTVVITPPFTLEFEVVRKTLTSTNVCQVRIYNLKKEKRNKLRFNISNYGTFRPLSLKAGYGSNIAEIFRGNVTQAWSVREGVDWITQIECLDGGFAFTNGVTATTIPSGTPLSTTIKTLMQSLPNVSVGVVGAYDQVSTRANTYNGNTADILKELTGFGFFIDSEKAHALQTNEYLVSEGPVLRIGNSSGLLGTPVLEETIVRFDMLFEPQLRVGTVAQLDSSTGVEFNGLYKIIGVRHRGMISDAVCGNLITTGDFFFSKLLTPAVR